MPVKTLRSVTSSLVFIVLLAFSFASGATRAQQAALDPQSADTDAGLRTLLANAEDLLRAGRAQPAYALLANEERRHAGNPLFDYLLGVAALDTGRQGVAVFSLQRALAVEPGFSGARLELARAYFESGYPERARPLFAQTLDENPPTALRETIVRYLLAIDAAPAAPESRLSVYAELTAGYDTNANGSTARERFLGYELNRNNVKQGSVFADIGAGFVWLRPVSERFAWHVSGHAGHRQNPDADFVDATVTMGDAGFQWRHGQLFGRASFGGYYGSRDGDSNESFAGVEALLGSRLTEDWDLSVSVRGGTQRYDDAIDILDVDQLLYALTLARRFANGARLSLAALGGSDDEREAGSPYGNRQSGARASVAVPIGPATRFAASVRSLRRDYDGMFFGSAREDQQLSANLELEFRDVWLSGLSVSPRVRFIDNRSDVSLYRYDRSEIGVGLKWTRQ
ncbi:MAG: surface lipoprotein assembly modifier [Woeseia sp.]